VSLVVAGFLLGKRCFLPDFAGFSACAGGGGWPVVATGWLVAAVWLVRCCGLIWWHCR